MKKILLGLAFALPLVFVSCEDPADDNSNDNNNDQNQNDGFWDVECESYYDSVPTTYCDSVWIADSTQGNYEYVCDTIITYDSLQNEIYDVECDQVWVNGSSQGGYYTTDCYTTYEVKLVEECDSVWVDDNATDSTQNNNGNNNGSQGYWDYQCDSVYNQSPNGSFWTEACDSVWVQ